MCEFRFELLECLDVYVHIAYELRMIAGAVFWASYIIPMASRVWLIRVVTAPSYTIPRPYSNTSSWVGALLVVAIVGITGAAFVTSSFRLKVNAIQAATTAHELTVAFACHELRNPNHAISSAARLLLDEACALGERAVYASVYTRCPHSLPGVLSLLSAICTCVNFCELYANAHMFTGTVVIFFFLLGYVYVY